ncbi:sorting nexin-16-like [Mugil cephalus]|uniref:sorting nexin-16-like n=1 Tax=Mugil cephalus TaxID=48193 RepID=UPI001FB779E5|nr:sorting nexin-16-like [Mugil cephalus]XP_047444477.1 sorting nexin-16-like [Mugil cephalus]
MAVPFVPVPFPVDRFEINRRSPVLTNSSSTKRETSPPKGNSLVRGHGRWSGGAGSPTLDESCSRGGPLEGSPTLRECEGNYVENWEERPITPELMGHEILEERAKFTVYKILVTGSQGDSWVIFRRYTDFCSLNDKLKDLFPGVRLALPHKRWFRDNYDEEFLEERQIGLQNFLQNLTLHKDVIRSKAVRRFLRLVDRPCLFDSLEESRAFCETLDETNHRLQRELLEKQREADTLKKMVEEAENRYDLLVKKVKSLALYSERCETAVTDARHREGRTDVNGFKQEHTNGDKAESRGYSVTKDKVNISVAADVSEAGVLTMFLPEDNTGTADSP